MSDERTANSNDAGSLNKDVEGDASTRKDEGRHSNPLIKGEAAVTNIPLQYNPRDVRTWTDEQRMEALRKQMAKHEADGMFDGPLVEKTPEEIEAVLREMNDAHEG